MSMEYAGRTKAEGEELERLQEAMQPEEIREIVKRLYYSGNGMQVGFSTIFNAIVATSKDREEAMQAFRRLAAEFGSAFEDYYAGKLNSNIVDGVKVQARDIKSRKVLN